MLLIIQILAIGLNETDDGWDKPLKINLQWIV